MFSNKVSMVCLFYLVYINHFFFFFKCDLMTLSMNKFGSPPWSQCVSTTGTVEYEEAQLSSVSTLEPFTLTLVQETLHVWSRLCLHLRGHRKCMCERERDHVVKLQKSFRKQQLPKRPNIVYRGMWFFCFT